jgi:hypothetical protein
MFRSGGLFEARARLARLITEFSVLTERLAALVEERSDAGRRLRSPTLDGSAARQ